MATDTGVYLARTGSPVADKRPAGRAVPPWPHGPSAHIVHRCRDRAKARLHRGRNRSSDRGDRARRLEGNQSSCCAEAVGRRCSAAAPCTKSPISPRRIARVQPDALLVDVNCWGALSAAEAGGIPWACFSPYTPPLRSPGVPPFGLGLRPMSGALGRVRDAAVRTAVVGSVERVMLPPINTIRADIHVGPVASVDGFLRRAPLMLVASAKPFQYPQTDWGDAGADDRALRA